MRVFSPSRPSLHQGAITAAYGFLSTYTAQVSRHIELLDELGTKEYKDVCDKTEKKKQKAGKRPIKMLFPLLYWNEIGDLRGINNFLYRI